MDYSILPGPGELNGPLPDPGTSDLENLTASFNPQPAVTFPPTTMNLGSLLGDAATSGSTDFGWGANPLTGVGLSSAPSPSTLGGSLLGFFEGTSTNLLNAFVTNPQNAQTAEQQQIASAQVTSALSSQWFGYLIIGLVLFLVVGSIRRN